MTASEIFAYHEKFRELYRLGTGHPGAVDGQVRMWTPAEFVLAFADAACRLGHTARKITLKSVNNWYKSGWTGKPHLINHAILAEVFFGGKRSSERTAFDALYHGFDAPAEDDSAPVSRDAAQATPGPPDSPDGGAYDPDIARRATETWAVASTNPIMDLVHHDIHAPPHNPNDRELFDLTVSVSFGERLGSIDGIPVKISVRRAQLWPSLRACQIEAKLSPPGESETTQANGRWGAGVLHLTGPAEGADGTLFGDSLVRTPILTLRRTDPVEPASVMTEIRVWEHETSVVPFGQNNEPSALRAKLFQRYVQLHDKDAHRNFATLSRATLTERDRT